MPEDRVADIVKMGDLAIVEKQAVLEFAAIPYHATVADDHILANVGPVPDLTIPADNRRTFDHHPVFHRGPFADENVGSDPSASIAAVLELGFEVFLDVFLDSGERLPSEIAAFKNPRMVGLRQVEEVFGSEHAEKAKEKRLHGNQNRNLIEYPLRG